MNNPQLEAGDVAFSYGKKLHNNAVSVRIESKEDTQSGKISAAKITIVYELDPMEFLSSNTKNVPDEPGPYIVNFDEVGYVGNGEIFNDDLENSELYVTFIGDQAYLNTRIPLADAKKRENINKRETAADIV
jgi:hypothetical protein